MSTDTPAAAPTPDDEGWHAPGIGEVHNADHSQMVYCYQRSDDPERDGADEIVDDALARRVRAALSAPVAAQPAASGVDALWVDEAMKLAKLSESASLRDFNYQGDDQKRIAENWAAYEAARDALRTHLSTALTGAAPKE